MARILLIFPDMRQHARYFPHSLLPVAGYLRAAGHHVRLLDLQVENLEDIDPRGFDVAGLSTYTGSQIAGAIEAASFVSENSPGTVLVWGGVHPSMVPHQTVQHQLVDVVVRGEGEKTLTNLVEALESNSSLLEIPGLTFIEGEEIIDTPDADHIDLNAVPFLPYDLIQVDRYPSYSIEPRTLYVESSRGCPHDCGFCYAISMHHRRWRFKSVDRVLDEMENIIDRLNPQKLFFIDDNFAVSTQRVWKIAQGILDRGIKITWYMNSRFDYASKYDGDFYRLLKESGCESLACAGESGSERILDLVNKGINKEQMRMTINSSRDYGLYCGVNFMAGFPTETLAEVDDTINIMHEILRIDPNTKTAVSVYTPFPGTPLYPLALSNGFRERDSLEEWSEYQFAVVQNLPWLKGRMKSAVRAIGLLARTTFISPRYETPTVLKGRKIMSLAHRLLSASARFRWKHRLFVFAPEWRLVDILLRFSKSWER